MRRAIVVAVVLGLVTVAATAVAVPPPSLAPTVPTVVPTARAPVPSATIRVVGFVNHTQAKPAPGPMGSSPFFYKSGPVTLNVEIENTGTTARSVIVQVAHGSTTMTQTVTVRPKGKGAQPTEPNTNVQLTDPGIEESCGPHTYTIKLEGEGTDPRVRHAAITPNCKWTSQVQDAWVATVPPDLSWKEFVSTVEVGSAPSCTTTASMKATVVSNNTKAGTPVVVTGSNGNTVRMQSAPFALPAQQQTTVVALGGESSGGVAPVDLTIALADPTHALTGTLVPHSLVVRFNRACVLDAGVLTD